MSDASRAVMVARTKGDSDREALVSVTKQSTCAKIIHDHLQKKHMETSSATETKIFFDNSSYIGSRSLSSLPLSPDLKLKFTP